MKNWLGGLLKLSPKVPQKQITIKLKSMNQTHQLHCQEGQNMMDATNKTVNQNINIYGLCDKQLACTTCSVQILSKYDRLPLPSQEQLDILYGLNDYKQSCTRMACQIFIKEQLNGMVVNVPKKSRSTYQ